MNFLNPASNLSAPAAAVAQQENFGDKFAELQKSYKNKIKSHLGISKDSEEDVAEKEMAELKEKFENIQKILGRTFMDTQVDNMKKIIEMTSCQDTNIEIENLRVEQRRLKARLLTVFRQLEVKRCHRKPLQPREDSYRRKIEEKLDEADLANYRLQDIEAKDRNVQHGSRLKALMHIKDDQFDDIYATLRHQQEGLLKLTEILKKDEHYLKIMREKSDMA